MTSLAIKEEEDEQYQTCLLSYLSKAPAILPFEFETWECEECGREVDDADIDSPLMGDDDDWEDE